MCLGTAKGGPTPESVEFVASKLDAEGKFGEFSSQLIDKKHVLQLQISDNDTVLVATLTT